MVIEARKLCGEHIGRMFLTRTYQYGKIVWEPRAVTMITHKKNGDVNMRVGQVDHRFKADSLVTLED